ncbi:putative Helix-turn-helix domain of transposase IS66 [compost metagenome]
MSPDQLALAFAQLPQETVSEAASPTTESPAMAQGATDGTVRSRPSPTGRKPFPKHLPRQRVVVTPADQDLTCGCGQRKTQIAEKVTERLDYVPASAVVLETVRPVFSARAEHT